MFDSSNQHISIHAPAKGATTNATGAIGIVFISIHAPAKGATKNPRSCQRSNLISIHAPAKGATTDPSGLRIVCKFQSTLPRRERHTMNNFIQTLQNFNPRSREGSDEDMSGKKPMTYCISIHAPAKGATVLEVVFLTSAPFQSTLPRRERRESIASYCLHSGYFNPRSREGSDIDKVHRQHYHVISIHAPAKGATATNSLWNVLDIISIHAPAKGATCSIADLLITIYNFNPRSREGSDQHHL